MDNREAYIVLNMISGVGTSRFKALLKACGSAANIFKRSQRELAAIRGVSLNLAQKILNWERDINLKEELALAQAGGVQIITLADEDYPNILKNIYDPPLCLYVRGTLPRFTQSTIAIVGSRLVTTYGIKMTRHFSEAAASAGWEVISGLAYGVDKIAHETTLEANGNTIAVLGSGLMRVQPQDHVPLARRIVSAGGAIVSEFPMNYPASRQSFPRRNRIISGLSQAILVVEGGLKSGALITATLGLEQGKTVFAVPGHADNPQAKGCHKLIKEGAVLAEDFTDILQEMELLPFAKRDTEEVSDEVSEENLAQFSAEERVILELLKLEARSFEFLANETGYAAGSLAGILMKLELQAVITQSPGQIYSLY